MGSIAPDVKALRRIWWQGFRSARSTEGYSVRLRGLDRGLEYREDDRVMRIGVERAAVEVDWSIYTSFMERWLPPHEGEILTEEKRAQIRQRVLAA